MSSNGLDPDVGANAGVGYALCQGAFTIINGIACGLGGACGVELRLMARFALTDRPGELDFTALGPGANHEMDDRLAQACATRLLEDTGSGERLGADIETVSEIPASRGLKSSSAAANAMLLAGLSALGRQLEPLEVVRMGVECACEAGVTLTGAFDDAVVTMFGGAVLTDNTSREILSWTKVPPDLRVLFLVPDRKIRKANLRREDFAEIGDEVKRAFDIAMAGDIATAITLNGRAYAPLLGVDTTPVDASLAAGAWAAGMTGTGPAIAVLATVEALEAVLAALAPFKGTLVRTVVSAAPGRVLSEGEYSEMRAELLGGGNHG